MSKQKNVQQQNAEQKQKIYDEVKYWRKQGVPKAIADFLQGHDINANTSIFFDYLNDGGYGIDEGMFVTIDKRFYEFDLQLNHDKSKLIEVHSFIELTEYMEINEHKKGTGKTLGYLALEILKEINYEH